jgi:hypothetical protein
VADGTKLSEEAEKLARAVAGADPSPQRLYYARIIAETQFTLARISMAKITTINLAMADKESTEMLSDPVQRCAVVVVKSLKQLRCLERYERGASSRFSRALRLLSSQ